MIVECCNVSSVLLCIRTFNTTDILYVYDECQVVGKVVKVSLN